MKRKYVLIGISVLIVVCIIVIVCTFGCNYSRINGGSPALLINSVNAEPGEKDVKVGIEIKNNPGIASITADIKFDTTALSLSNIEYNHEITQNASTLPINKSASPIRLSVVKNSGNIEGDCTLAELSFDINDTAEGEYEIALSYNPDDIYDDKEKNVE